MPSFSLSTSAAAEVRGRLENSGLLGAVASLIDYQSFAVSSDMVRAIETNANDSEKSEIARRDFNRVASTLDLRLTIGVYAADKCSPEDLLLVDGIRFAMPHEMRERLTNHVLDYEGGQFLLKYADRTFLRLRDLDKGNESAV
jgi:hypothetical protein